MDDWPFVALNHKEQTVRWRSTTTAARFFILASAGSMKFEYSAEFQQLAAELLVRESVAVSGN
jgi:hypothetical protein